MEGQLKRHQLCFCYGWQNSGRFSKLVVFNEDILEDYTTSLSIYFKKCILMILLAHRNYKVGYLGFFKSHAHWVFI